MWRPLKRWESIVYVGVQYNNRLHIIKTTRQSHRTCIHIYIFPLFIYSEYIQYTYSVCNASVYIIYNMYMQEYTRSAFIVETRRYRTTYYYCIMYIRNGIKANTISLHLPRTTPKSVWKDRTQYCLRSNFSSSFWCWCNNKIIILLYYYRMPINCDYIFILLYWFRITIVKSQPEQRWRGTKKSNPHGKKINTIVCVQCPWQFIIYIIRRNLTLTATYIYHF